MAEEKVEEAKDAKDKGPAEKKPEFFETKLFKLITLGIYLGGVGGMGFTLAIYYLFLWDSKMPELPILKKGVSH